MPTASRECSAMRAQAWSLVEDRVHARAGRGVMVEDDDADHADTTSERVSRGRHAIRNPTPVSPGWPSFRIPSNIESS
jgi:hypothetical protein